MPWARSCGICGYDVDAEHLERRDTGDFHRACFSALGVSGVGLKNSSDEQAECTLCSKSVAKGTVVVQLFGLGVVTHLRCFFGAPNGSARSLGARAASLSLVQRAKSLRQRSDALLALSRRLFAVPSA